MVQKGVSHQEEEEWGKEKKGEMKNGMMTNVQKQ
jgi:hypothetical protein